MGSDLGSDWWYWEGDKRICDGCGSTVSIFKEGAICNGCGKADPITDEITVEGTLGGDGECWCLVVDEPTYRRINGNEDADQEIRMHRELWYAPDGSYPKDLPPPPPIVWQLHPDDLIRPNSSTKVRLTIITEELED